MYLVSVYFDEKTNKILQRYINQIAEKTGNAFMLEHKVPPHMTILQIEARNEDALVVRMDSLRDTLQSGVIEIVSVGMLLPYVIYATPVLNEYLLDLSKSTYQTFEGIEDTKISKYYKPMFWLPHITLGKILSKEQIISAVEVMQNQFVPITAMVTEIGLAKVNPHEDIVRFKLKDY